MSWGDNDAAVIATEHLSLLGDRWSHVRTVGFLADQLFSERKVPDVLRDAAWLHDLGYAPGLKVSGFHSLDGANYLKAQGAPAQVVGLVAWHTGAEFEAAERGLGNRLSGFPVPDSHLLDTLTLLDLVSAPNGEFTTPIERLEEILRRYQPGDPVHEAVTFSQVSLRAATSRAREALQLPDMWPVGVLERMDHA